MFLKYTLTAMPIFTSKPAWRVVITQCRVTVVMGLIAAVTK